MNVFLCSAEQSELWKSS